MDNLLRHTRSGEWLQSPPATFNRLQSISESSSKGSDGISAGTSKRDFLKAMVGIAASAPWSGLHAQDVDFWLRPRELWLYHIARKEQIRVTYFEEGQINPDGYSRLCWFMRDTHVNQMVAMDTVLLDVLRGIQGFYSTNGWNYPIVLNSGFRSKETNDKLLGEGAKKNSMHLYGKAADIYMPGAPIQDVARLGLHFRQGGVGFYETKKFVHIDTGRVRVWRG
jgi:uncharacterized protein YcbK (DUF882 family)